jgi:hypothetical protein
VFASVHRACNAYTRLSVVDSIDNMPDSPQPIVLNDDGSLRKSGRPRKRPLPPDATYEQAKSPRVGQSSTPMPFSPEKLLGASNGTGDPSPNKSSGDGILETDDGEDDEPEEEPVWAEFSSDYYQGEHERIAYESQPISDILDDSLVVEQLPLELHRNFALLRELDEQTQRELTQYVYYTVETV